MRRHQQLMNETLLTLDDFDEAAPVATHAGKYNGSNYRGNGSLREGFSHGLFLEDVSEKIPDRSVVFVADELSETEDGFSSEEEWATLYGSGGGRGILGVLDRDSPTPPPCAEAPNTSGESKGGEGPKDSHSLPRTANGKKDAHASEGWWGGEAWGGEPRASGADQMASTYLVICRRGGGLEVHACQGRGKESSTRLVFRASKAVQAPPTLWNELLAPPISTSESDAEASPDDGDPALGESEIGDLRRRSDNDEAEGGRGLSVATGVLVANGRRMERGDGSAASNGSTAREVGREKKPPMEGDVSSVAPVPSTEGAKDGVGSGVTAVGYEGEDDEVMSLAVSDVLVHPVGAVDGPAALRRLVLVLHLENGDLLVYQARMTSCDQKGFCGREQVICFSKLSHDLITRPVKGVPHEAAVADPSRGRALRGVRSAAGQEGVCFARPGCRSAMILAERGAVCITPIEQDDLGDGSGSPPLPPGAPPSWAGVGLGCLAPLNNRGAFPGGGFVGVTAGGGRLRFISAAPAAAQLVTPGASGGGGLGGGGQGHFIAAKIGVGATVHGLLHLPHELAQPGKMGDILKTLLLKRGHYVALVSRMEDSLAEEPMAEEDVGREAEVEEDEEVEGIMAQHAVKHKNWTVADPALGGAPQLLVHRFELRVLALAPCDAATLSSAPRGAPDGVHKEPEGGVTGSGSVEDDGGGKSAACENGGGGGLGGEGVLVPDEFLSASTVESHPFDAEENALCMSLVKLEQGGSPRMHVAVGTGMNDTQGEDKAARGRLILFEVDYAYLAREGGGHEHAVKLRQVFAKEQLSPIAGESGPVSAVAQLGRHLILSVGKKVIVNRWDPKSRTLELIGFFDPRVYVVGLSVVKNRFVLVGDAYGSVQLVVWREEDHSLTQLSKDHEKCEVFSAEYLVDEPAMGIVVADERRNLKVLQYAPNAPNSRGGTKLLCQSDFFLGSRVAKLTRRRTRGNLKGGARYCLLAGTLDGGLGAILPVDERMFRRLYTLQGIMSNALGHNGSANPRAYRLFDRGPTFRPETKQNMLDGTLLWRFVGLDARTQHDLTRAIGTTVERVMSNLLDIDLASLF